MAYIILPSRRTRQPQGAVRVAQKNYWSLFAEPQWLYTGMGSGSWTPLEVTG